MTDQPADQAPDETTPAEADTADQDVDTAAEHDDEQLADGPEHPKMGNREAAKYRTRARSAEQERDTLAQRLAKFERRELERIASAKLADPSDFAPENLDELRDEDGELDETKVTAAVDELVKAKPHYRKQTPPSRSSAGIVGGTGAGSPSPRLGSIFSG